MRRQSPQTLLEYEAKRRPEIAAMMANMSMSEDEVRAAKFPMPWMRQAMIDFKREHRAAQMAETVLANAKLTYVADPVGEMRRWIGGNQFIRIGRAELEMQTGYLVWFDLTGVWIDTIHTTKIDPLLHANTVSCGRITRSGYMDAVRARLHQLDATPTSALDADPAALFRIYRPAAA